MNQDLETKGGNLSNFRVFSIYFVVFSPEVGNNFSISPFFLFRRSPFSWGKKMGKGPGLYTDIGKKARGDSSLASFLAFFF